MTQIKNELRRQIKDVRWMIFWVVLAQFAAEVAVEATFSFMENPPHQYVRSGIVEMIAIGVPLMVYARYVWGNRSKNVKKEFGLIPCDLHRLMLAAGLGICGQFVMILLNLPFNMLFEQPEGAVIPENPDASWFVAGIVSVVLIPAVLEEFWMRGVVFCAYNKSNTVAAIFFTSLVFAFLHMRINEIVGFMFMGIMASVIMLKSNSLYAAMIYHGFNNLTAFLLGPVIMPFIEDSVWLVFSVASILFVGLLFLLLLQKNQVKKNKVFDSGKLIITSVCSVPIILSVIVALIKRFGMS